MLNQLETNIGTEVTTWKAKLVAKEEELKLNTILTQVIISFFLFIFKCFYSLSH